jgi:hypothetical protein
MILCYIKYFFYASNILKKSIYKIFQDIMLDVTSITNKYNTTDF